MNLRSIALTTSLTTTLLAQMQTIWKRYLKSHYFRSLYFFIMSSAILR